MKDLGTPEERAWFLVLVIGFGHTMRSLSDIRPGLESHNEMSRDFYALKK